MGGGGEKKEITQFTASTSKAVTDDSFPLTWLSQSTHSVYEKTFQIKSGELTCQFHPLPWQLSNRTNQSLSTVSVTPLVNFSSHPRVERLVKFIQNLITFPSYP